jgi:hypothetical protein
MEKWAYIAGIVIGSAACISVCFVYVRKQIVGLGGGFLLTLGFALIGLSLWTTVSIAWTEKGWEVTFKTIKERIDAVAEASLTVSQEADTLAETVENNKQQLMELTHALAAPGRPSAEQLGVIGQRILSTRGVDRKRLAEAMQTLRIKPGK